MKTIQIQNNNQPLLRSLKAVYCDTFFCRLRGLMFRSQLDQEEGLLLVESRDSRVDTSIHMLFVPMDLAVVWINSKNVVVDVVLARAWHLFYAPHKPARFTLEFHPNRINEFTIGDHLEFKNA